jgi:HAE1 family hydrophobic/amphiphilic exporter-1
MNLSEPFIKRPVMTTFVMLAIIIAGLAAFRKLPVSDLPNIEHPSISVHAHYTGATPETMMNIVTIPIEKELANVKGVKEVSSKSALGSSTISLEFDFNKNMDEAERDVQAALNRAEKYLPHDMHDRPFYQKKEASEGHNLYLVLTSSTASLAELRDFSDLYIKPRLSRIEGVAAVDTFGAPYSITIKLNPELMAARQLGLNEVINAIKHHNAQMPLGTIKTGTRNLSIRISKIC